jgi:hypothetical protein
MNARAIIFAILVAGSMVSACDSVVTFDRENEVVVEGYLVADEAFGVLRLSRVQPVEDTYDFPASAVRGATVHVNLLGTSGDIESTVTYLEDLDQPGIYRAEEGAVVRPLRTYELVVEVPATGERITSRTTVPGAYEVIDPGPDRVVYQGEQRAEVLVTRSDYPGRQAVFVFSVESLEPSFANLTPFYLDVVDPDDDGDEEELDNYLINESPLLNEEGYDQISENVLRIQVPWLAFAFYGRNRLRSNALDDNLYDFIRSQSVQQGGSTFAPGEIPNILDRVEGGTGVFGSYSVVETEVYLERPVF